MMLVERGLADLDMAVEDVLPEFAKLRVLEGFEGDVPLLRMPKSKATIRQLATHSSGLEYELWNNGVAEYMKKTGHQSIITGTRASLHYPLMSDPGTRWAYGPGVDWLGLVIEAIDGRTIVDFCQEEIFDPLAMTATRFELGLENEERLSTVSLRVGDGTFEPVEVNPPSRPEIYAMGQALYGSASDYMRFLRMFLGAGQLDGKRLLSPGGAAAMLSDHLTGLRFAPMASCSPMSADFDPMPDARIGHSLGFVRNENDVPGRRSAGAQGWAGLLNSHYWFDPEQGIAGLFMTQMLPFADSRYMRRYAEFETAVYATYRDAKSGI
jgi:CubicO group peptidase (beta-lactamase class C family)